jgi:hypothetical protein
MSASPPDYQTFLLNGVERLGVDYDERADVLYLWRGDAPRKAICVDSTEGFLVRFAFDSDEIVGFTILDFCRRWQADDQETPTLTVTLPSLGLRDGVVSAPQIHTLVAA